MASLGHNELIPNTQKGNKYDRCIDHMVEGIWVYMAISHDTLKFPQRPIKWYERHLFKKK